MTQVGQWNMMNKVSLDTKYN